VPTHSLDDVPRTVIAPRRVGTRRLSLISRLELRPGPLGGNLIWPGVDLEQEVAGLEPAPLLVLLAQEVSGDPVADLRGDEPPVVPTHSP